MMAIASGNPDLAKATSFMQVEYGLDDLRASWAIWRKRKSHFVRFGFEIDDVFGEGFCELIAEVFACFELDAVMFGGVNEPVP